MPMERVNAVDKLALIMAAGEGTRMLSSIPKNLHQVCGIPMIEHVLRALSPVVSEKVVIVGHMKERVTQSIHGNVSFIEQQPGGWGTGFAVKSAASKLEGRKGQVIVTAGDMPLVLTETFAKLMSEVERGNACAMLTERMENPIGYGRVVRENGKITGIVEQKDLVGEQHNIKEMNASVYCFDIEALLSALPKLTNNNNANEYYLTEVISILHQDGHSIVAVPTLEKSECLGINDRCQLAVAEREMRNRINTRHMRAGVTITDPETTTIHPDVVIGRDTIIYPGCSIEKKTTIGAGCVLRDSRIVKSHVGDNARIEHSVVIDAKVSPDQRVGPYEVIRGAKK